MAGFNPLKEKIHTFEEATKILRWDSYSLLRKANEDLILSSFSLGIFSL